MKKFLHFLALGAMLCIPWVTQAQSTLTVNDGTQTSEFVPIYGYYADDISMSQFIVPATDLAAMAGNNITGLTFYSSNSSVSWGSAQFEVYMAEVSYTTFTSGTPDWTGMTKVMDASALSVSGNQMVITLDEAFTYNGSNLMVGIKETSSGSWNNVSWYGVNQSGNTAIGNENWSGSTYELKQFLPKVTFTFEVPPACPKPTGLTATDLTTSSATLGWTSSASNFNVRYRTAAAVSNVTFFDDFENGMSQWTIYTDGEAPQTDGWYTIDVANSGLSFSAHSDTYCASAWSWNSDSYNADNWLVTPQVELGGILKFWVCTNSAYPDSYEVLLSTTTNDESAFTVTLQAMAAAPTNGEWNEVIIDLSAYSGNGYIAIHHESYDANYLLIDDFGVYGTTPAGEWQNATATTNSLAITGLSTETTYDFEVQADCGTDGTSVWVSSTFTTNSSCMPVSNLEVTDATATTIALSWTDQNGGSATYVVTNASDEAYTITGLTATGCTVTGLTANTAYTFKVKADCGGGYSTVETVNGHTPCAAITTFPWTEDFESATASTVLDCWDNSASTSSTLSNYPEYIWGVYEYNSNKMLRMHNYYVYSGTALINTLPITIPATGDYQLTFDYAHNASCGDFTVKVSTNGGASFSDLQTYSQGSGSSYDNPGEFTEATISLASYAGQTIILQFFSTANYGMGAIFVDNVHVGEIPNCVKPNELSATATAHEAELSWTANNSETQWTLYWKEASATDYTAVTVTTNPYTLTGLAAQTDYMYYVVANCSSTEMSEPSSVFNFTTECEAVAALGYTENFDAATAGSMPLCWNKINTTSYSYYQNYPQVYADGYYTYSNSSPNCLFFYSYGGSSYYDPQPQYAVLPEMDGLAGKQVTLQAKGYDASSTFYVGTMSDPADAATFTAIGGERSLTTSYQEVLVNIPSNTTDHYLAIMIDAASSSRTTNGLYIDDIAIANPPSCAKPTDLTVTYTGGTTAEVSWTSEATAWNIDVNGTVTAITENPYTLTGLSLGTVYNLKVQADCGSSNGTSEWTNPVSFTTDLCLPANQCVISYSFTDQYDDSWNGASITVVDVETLQEIAVLTMPNVAGPYEGNFSVCDGRSIKFVWTKGSYPGETGFVFTDINGEVILSVAQGSAPTSNGDLLTYTVSCAITNCKRPTDLTNTEVTNHTAVLGWTENGEATAWKVAYKTGSDDFTFVDANTNSLPLSGLTADATYTWKVRPVCTDFDNKWSNEKTFTTDEACPLPTSLAYSGLKANQVTLTWNSQYTSNWIVRVHDVDADADDDREIDDHDAIVEGSLVTYVLDGLDPEKEYTVKVSSNCEASVPGDDVSDWTPEMSFTTLADCSLDNVVVSNVGAHVADVAWDGQTDERFNLYLGQETVDEIINEDFADGVPTNSSSVIWTNNTENNNYPWVVENGYFKSGNGGVSSSTSLLMVDVILPNSGVIEFDAECRGEGTYTSWDKCIFSLDETVQFTYGAHRTNDGFVHYSYPVSAGQHTLTWVYQKDNSEDPDGDYMAIDNFRVFEITGIDWDSNPIEVDGAESGHHLEDLEAGTTYYVKVSPSCDETIEAISDPFTTVALPSVSVKADKWYALSSPMHYEGQTYERVEDVSGLIANDPVKYDFLRYDEPTSTWESYKQHTAGFVLEQGRGYIYRRSADATLTVDGEPNTGNVSIQVTASAAGWNLVGNPYLTNIARNTFGGTATLVSGGYTLATGGTWTAIYNYATIAAGQAVLVKATNAGTLTFTAPAAKSVKGDVEEDNSLAFIVRNSEFEDVAYALFEDGEGLPKINHLNAEAPMLSIAMADDNYAIAMVGNAEQFPLHFSGQGNYTLTVKGNTDVTGYLHLLDRATGLDIDLLSTPEYTFTATAAGDRFLVKLTPDAEGFDFGGFARVSGSQLTVDGQGELQVFDVMGRQLGSAQVDGTTTLDGRSLGIQSSGVYVLRLGGESQKIVVK